MHLAGFICYGKFPYAAPMMIAPIPLVLAILNCVILPIMVGHALIEIASVAMILMTSISPEMYQTMKENSNMEYEEGYVYKLIGFGKSWWRLRQDVLLEKVNDTWIIKQSKASSY